MNLCNAPELKALLARHGFRFSKSKGQNFLIASWVPEDIAVVGYDGIPMSSFSVPRLTTVRQDTQRLAERGVDVLLRNIERPNRPFHEVVPFQLIPGESVACIPSHDG